MFRSAYTTLHTGLIAALALAALAMAVNAGQPDAPATLHKAMAFPQASVLR